MEVPSILSSEPLRITPLGAGNEVGRSCILLNYKGKNILLDCGIHPAYSGISALPFFDEIDPATIDAVLVTHFHLDHAASLPYFTEKTTFKGKIYMTHPTKSIFKWLLSDYVRVSNVSVAEDVLYNEQDLLRCCDKIIPIDFHQQIDLDGIKFTAFNAGHVLGAAMFLIEIAGVRVFYTGDYSREEDRHLMVAERPPADQHIDVMICESTYGVQSHMPREDRERRFTSLVHEIVKRGGRCLLPVFALGRAQELLLILDEYWQSNAELQQIPIYFASSLAKRCITIYQTYINMMNDRIKKQFAISNPFVFKYISSIKSIEQFDDVGPCVMLASPGMLQNGLSRELFEQWCPNRKNGVIVAGYCVEGTLAKHILNEPVEVSAMSGAKIPLKMTVEYISFSAHVDFQQNSQFIEEINPANVVFVHGEHNEMNRLRNAMQYRCDQRSSATRMFCPRNCETVTLEFRGDKFAHVIGSAAATLVNSLSTAGSAATSSAQLTGVLVGKDFQYEIIDAADLSDYTSLSLCTINQRLFFTCTASFSVLEFHISQLLGRGNVRRVSPSVLVAVENVKIEDTGRNNTYVMEWSGNAINDMIADAIAAISFHSEVSRASVKMTKSQHSHSHSHAADHGASSIDADITLKYLTEHFERVDIDEDEGVFVIGFGDSDITAKVNIDTMIVSCDDEEKKFLIEKKLLKLFDVFQVI